MSVGFNSDIKPQITWISTMRGFAALLVFISHLPLNMTYETGFVIGRIGVTVFFLISGYLSVSSRNKMSGKRYLFNRFARIYPIYWLLLFLRCLLMDPGELSPARIAANFTCFQEFFRQENIIGSSWMLPIQLSFFGLIAIAGSIIYWYTRKKEITSVLVVSVIGIFAILLGFIRFKTGRPFPTAFFLLLNTAFLGYYHKMQIDGQLPKKTMAWVLAVFEASLAIAVYLSYQNMFFHYVFAYNIGIFLVLGAEKINLKFDPFINLGKIGYAFFLGAGIPYALVGRFVDFSTSAGMRIAGSIVKLILSILFAYLVTTLIEKPLQKKLKAVEARL